jgi:hypothetical protein
MVCLGINLYTMVREIASPFYGSCPLDVHFEG